MSKRNFILLIITLIIIGIAVFGFFYFRQQPVIPTEDNGGGTNFFSQFNPFGNKKPTPPVVIPPVDVSGYQPNPTEPEVKQKLIKVSSMPVAGFIALVKERLIDVPVKIPTTTPSTPYNFGTITLKNGNTGEAVKEIQRFLNNTLNLSLELNGVLDAETITVIKQWQSDNGLVADGVIGAKTKAKMYSSVNQTTKPTPPLTEFVPSLRYVDRATGNIYQTFADKIEERKFSITLIPKVYEAFFGSKGESVIVRYLNTDGKTIETFVGTLPREYLGADTTPENEVKGSFLPENITDISMSPDAGSAFYLFNVGDNIVGTTLNLSNNKKVQVFDSPFTEWLSLWPNSKMITFTTKPSSGIPGYMYGMDPTNNRNLNKILGDINGLTTFTSPNGKLVLYSDDILSLGVYHTDTKVPTPLGVKTLPEKCVWGKLSDIVYCAVPKSIDVGQYPDAWYQGEVSFSDQFWKIDIATGNATMVLDPITIAGGEEIDGIKLAMDEGENYLFFVNKKDSFLWELNLK
jgi:peptidoglycan hydrolase-like protein with peptidoglycan-binding domain